MLNADEIYLEKFDNIKYKIDNIENSSLPSNEFDCILLSNIIHIVESPHKALQEC
jgi:ubiquinone/menaquinone biosynthesis C-methylase UbiE